VTAENLADVGHETGRWLPAALARDGEGVISALSAAAAP